MTNTLPCNGAKTHKRAKLCIDAEILRQQMKLPDNVEIVSVYQGDLNKFCFIVEGDGVPDAPEVRAVFHVETIYLETPKYLGRDVPQKTESAA